VELFASRRFRPGRASSRGIVLPMTPPNAAIDNRDTPDYDGTLRAIADRLASWEGPIVVVAHVDPDGDALGSALTVARALRALGKDVTLPMEVPDYLAFLVEDGETSAPLEALPEGTLLCVLDVADEARIAGAPTDGAAFVVNVDHHGTNARFGDLALVTPSAAATAILAKDLVDALPVAWTADLATPCLTGVLTDTGTFRNANTDARAFAVAQDLVAHGVDYAALSDRLQWRPPAYLKMLAEALATLRLPFGGRCAMAEVSLAAKARIGGAKDENDDVIDAIRYVEGSYVAVLLKQKEDAVKISVRSRPPVSAQAICVAMGGGGHVPAAGAKLEGSDLDAARARVEAEVGRELARHGLTPDG